MINYRDVLTKKFLEENYVKKKLDINVIAKHIGCDRRTVKEYLDRYEITISNRKDKPKNVTRLPPSKFRLIPGQDIDEKVLIRFWSYVDKKDNHDCWNWIGCLRHNYGVIGINYKVYLASRVSFFIRYGYCDPNLYVLHNCDNPRCVNPNHLRQDTHRANIDDMLIRNRSTKGDKNWCSKLTWDDVKEIRMLWTTTDMSMNDISKRFGVWVGKIVTNKQWFDPDYNPPNLNHKKRTFKLDKETANIMRNEHKNGLSKEELATKYNMTISGIKSVIYNQRWK